MKIYFLFISVLFSIVSFGQTQKNLTNEYANIPLEKNKYFGLKPPGKIPEIFAPGIVSDTAWAEHCQVAVSPKGDEIFWSVWTNEYKTEDGKYNTEQLYYSKIENGKWSKPRIAEFTKTNIHGLNGGPVFSLDGNKIYFYQIPSPWRSSYQRTKYVEKIGNSWSEPIDVGEKYNSGKNNYAPIFTNKNSAFKYDGKILKYKYENKKFTFLNNVRLNKDYRVGWNVYVAPNEEYMIFAGLHKNNYGDLDLFITYNEDGKWGEPINLGNKINTEKRERFPIVSPDGKYLFFMRHTKTQDFFWVSTDFIKNLEKKHNEIKVCKEKLFNAVKKGKLNIVKQIIKSYPQLINCEDEYSNTPLLLSCFVSSSFKRYPEIAKYLITKGADVNKVNDQNATALMRACVGYGPDLELIKLLVQNGADVNFISNNGLTPLHYAALYRDKPLAEFLISNNAEVNLYSIDKEELVGSTISGSVVQVSINFAKGDDNITKYLIDQGADINKTDQDGNNEIHLAIFKSNFKLVKLLIESGVNINHKNNFDKSPLYYAATHGFEKIYNYLITKGAVAETKIKKNFGTSKELTKKLNIGEAFIWDLGGYCHAVKTKNNFLIFSLGKKIDEETKSGLAQGKLSTFELADQNITFFLRNRDYYQPPADDIEQLKKLSNKTELVSCYEPVYKSSKKKYKDVILAKPRMKFQLKDKNIYPIKSLCGGMGYLVEVDGLRIFHAGLHISDLQERNIVKFKNEIDWLAKTGEIDLVFITVHSHSNKLRGSYEPYKYLINKLKPKKIFLYGPNITQQYYNCYDSLKGNNGEIIFPEFKSSLGLQYYYGKKH